MNLRYNGVVHKNIKRIRIELKNKEQQTTNINKLVIQSVKSNFIITQGNVVSMVDKENIGKQAQRDRSYKMKESESDFEKGKECVAK